MLIVIAQVDSGDAEDDDQASRLEANGATSLDMGNCEIAPKKKRIWKMLFAAKRR
jgi:hypothetical protein